MISEIFFKFANRKYAKMKTILYSKFDKKEIKDLPRVIFPGRIVVVKTAEGASAAVDYLLQSDILGIDTETRPSFKKGIRHKVALLQVSTREVCFLFRLNIIGITDSIIRLLEDTSVPKIGLSLHDDFRMLNKRVSFKPGYFIDLQDYVKDLGIHDLSLQKLYANVFGEKIVKREQLTNWENTELTDKQKRYASTDAWTCINLYLKLKELKETGDYKLVENDLEPSNAPFDTVEVNAEITTK